MLNYNDILRTVAGDICKDMFEGICENGFFKFDANLFGFKLKIDTLVTNSHFTCNCLDLNNFRLNLYVKITDKIFSKFANSFYDYLENRGGFSYSTDIFELFNNMIDEGLDFKTSLKSSKLSFKIGDIEVCIDNIDVKRLEIDAENRSFSIEVDSKHIRIKDGYNIFKSFLGKRFRRKFIRPNEEGPTVLRSRLKKIPENSMNNGKSY